MSQIVYNTENSGSTFKQWNKSIELTKGKYIWIADSDDVAEPTLLEKLVAGIETNKNVVIAYCQSNRMNSKGIITGNWQTQTEKQAKRYRFLILQAE